MRRAIILAVTLLSVTAIAIIIHPASADTRQIKPDVKPGIVDMQMVKMLYANTIIRDYRLVNSGGQYWCDVRILKDTDEGPAIESHILTTSDPMIHDLLFFAYMNWLKIIVKAHSIQTPTDRNEPPYDATFYEIDEITIDRSVPNDQSAVLKESDAKNE